MAIVISTLEDGLVVICYDNKKIFRLHFQVDMARGLYLLSLLLMSLFLLSHILAQKRGRSYKEKIREKMEERHEKREHREERKEALGWRRRKRSAQGMSMRKLLLGDRS